MVQLEEVEDESFINEEKVFEDDDDQYTDTGMLNSPSIQARPTTFCDFVCYNKPARR